MSQASLAKKIEAIGDLPTLPSTVFEAVRLLDEPETTTDRIISSLQLDQAVVSKLLRMANSSFYGFRGRISNISQALRLLGFDAVKNAILSISILDIFSGGAKEKRFDPHKFWLHAIGTGVISQVIAKKLKNHQVNNFFIAGLLHDIGKLAIIKLFPDDFLQILKKVEKEDLFMIDGERALLEVDHTHIGYEMAKKWYLPEEIQEAIGLHHCPGNAEKNRVLSATIHLSDCLCTALGFGGEGDLLVPELDPKALAILGIDLPFVAGCLADIDLEMERAESLVTLF